jgi:hypothetical protein
MHHRGPTDLGRAEAGPTGSGKSAASPASSASLAGSTSMPDDSASSALRRPANHTPAKNRRSIGTLAVAQGRPEEGRGLLDEGLKLSLAAHSTPSVTLCLAAFARLAFVEGDPERAAVLAGAAECLRRRVGLQGRTQLTGPARGAGGLPAATWTPPAPGDAWCASCSGRSEQCRRPRSGWWRPVSCRPPATGPPQVCCAQELSAQR